MSTQLDWIEQLTAVRYKDGATSPNLVAAFGIGKCHAWAISDACRDMCGGFGKTPAAARNDALRGLMMGPA